MSDIDIVTASDIGLRKNLEDAMGSLQIVFTGYPHQRISIATLCDGVGGAQHGELASNLVVPLVNSILAAELTSLFGCSEATGNSDMIIELLKNAIINANQTLLQKIQDQPFLQGMSTTIVSAVVIDDRLYLAWAGDSRAYLYRQGILQLQTNDHSEVQRLVREGLLEPQQVKNHPLAHTIYRYVGQGEDFSVETATVALEPDDLIVLCTDGLTDGLTDLEIQEYLRTHHRNKVDFEKLPYGLTRAALAAGSSDNITVLCEHYNPSKDRSTCSRTITCTGAYPVHLARVLTHY